MTGPNGEKLTVTCDEAAAMLDMSPGRFKSAVARGELPEALIKGCPPRWSVPQILKKVAGEAETAPSSPPESDPAADALDEYFPREVPSRN